MQLVIPFAAPWSEAGRAAAGALRWPGLRRLLAARTPQIETADETSLSPPHERALARAWGWSGGDGALPFAAQAAREDGIDPGGQAWGQLTPVHWHLGTEQLSMADPEQLALDHAASRTLFDAVAPLFTSEGFVMRWAAPLRWYLAHESLAALPTASPDRVIGRNVDRWLVGGTSSRLWQRLHNEVQMLLHTHDFNATREADGLPTVNSVWLSGCGVAQPCHAPARLDARLRRAALSEDWPGWGRAWQALDAELAAAPPERLTLCGERGSATFELAPRGAIGRLRAALAPADLAALLERL